MNLRKNNSAREEIVKTGDIKIYMASPKEGVFSEQAMITSVLRSRHRIPTIIRSSLRDHHSDKRSVRQEQENAEDVNSSKVGMFLKNGIRSALSKIKSKPICEICEGQIQNPKQYSSIYLCQCEHKDNFCESCLHHYVIYKVRTFQEVYCPHEDCPQVLDTTSNFFKNLPADIQKNYKKLHQFYTTSKDPTLKLCPKQNCDGMIKLTENAQNKMICNTCLSEFCSKCLLEAHEGECDEKELKFFQENLHYRQCVKCKFVIEKDQGCNHITCRCGYQFCYVCGSAWSSPHYNNHDQNGNLIQTNQNANAAPPINPQQPCCDCGCLDELCGQTLASIFKLPFKFILLLLLYILVIFIFISRDLFIYIGLFITTIIAGIFGYSCEILSEAEGALCVLGVIFFPVVMIMGIGRAFREVFCDIMPELFEEEKELCCGGTQRICIT